MTYEWWTTYEYDLDFMDHGLLAVAIYTNNSEEPVYKVYDLLQPSEVSE